MSSKKELSLKNIIKTEFERLGPNDTVIKALDLVVNQGYHVCIIIDEKGTVLGVVRERDMIGKKVQPQTNLSRLLKSVPELMEDSDLVLAAERLFDANSRVLPVVDKTGKLKGVITDVDLVSALLMEDIEIQSVIEVDMETPPSLDVNESVSKAITILHNQGISRIPITKDGQVTGIFSTHDACSLLRPATRATDGDVAGDRARIKSEITIGVVARPLTLIKPETTIGETVKLMIEQNVSSFLVGEESEIYRLLTIRDIIAHILLQYEIEQYTIQVIGAPDSDVRAAAFDRGSRVINRYQTFLGESGQLNIRFKKIPYQSKRGMFRWKCQVRLITDRGRSFSTSADEWGSEAAVSQAIDKLDRVIVDERKYRIDTKRKIQRATRLERRYPPFVVERVPED
jgi:CBS domain-containing protein